MIHFADPYYLLALTLIPALIWNQLRKRKNSGGKIKYSDIRLLKGINGGIKPKLRHSLFALRLLAFAFLIIALARPQSSSKEKEVSMEGVDIVLAMDISESMLAEDFKPNNRLTAAKIVAKEFIEGRSNDRLGLIVFAGLSFTQCPLTLDYGVLLTLLDQVKIADKDWGGTAIGMGIINAVNRLKNSKAKSKVIILLTDGENNRGQIDPVTAAKIAKTFNIRIYTIGVGSKGTAMFPVMDPVFGKRYVPQPVKIDEETLTEIAKITEAQYFRATDENKLREIYDEIGELEKTKIEVKEYTNYEELFVWFLSIGLLLLLLELILNNTYFKKLP
jgi:Ca-activated chloride channel family protein